MTVCPVLEAEFGDAQEFEFTVQDGELFLLQTRTAKRTTWAALRISGRSGAGRPPIQRAKRSSASPGLDLDGIRRVHVRDGDQAVAICRAQPGEHGRRKRSDRARRRGCRAHRRRGARARC